MSAEHPGSCSGYRGWAGVMCDHTSTSVSKGVNEISQYLDEGTYSIFLVESPTREYINTVKYTLKWDTLNFSAMIEDHHSMMSFKRATQL